MSDINAPEPLPPELDQDFQARALASESLILSQKYSEAAEGFRQLYELLLKAQPAEKRYHKGYPLHNIGYNLLKMGKGPEALRYFVLAYIEDLLSEKARQEKADELPAGKNLRLLYRVQENALEGIKRIVRDRSNRVVRDPDEIFNELVGIKPAEKTLQPAQTQPITSKKKKIRGF